MKKKNPTTTAVKEARLRLELSREDAGRIVYCTARAWQEWELGNRQMHPAMWELFNIKTQPKTPEISGEILMGYKKSP